MKRMLAVGALALAVVGVAGTAGAAPIFAGSWLVDDGPNWATIPESYTGQEAAALLFGGLPGDYAISTVDNDPNHIDNLAWVSTWGGACAATIPDFPCGTRVAENFEQSTDGDDLYDSLGDTSAYVQDWAIGNAYRNFAFKVDQVPEPASMTLLGLGLAATGLRLRRRRAGEQE